MTVGYDDFTVQLWCSTMSSIVHAKLFAVARVVVSKDGGVGAK